MRDIMLTFVRSAFSWVLVVILAVISLTGCGEKTPRQYDSEGHASTVTQPSSPPKFSGCMLYTVNPATVINLRMVSVVRMGYREVDIFSGSRYFGLAFPEDSLVDAFNQISQKLGKCNGDTLPAE